jgi:hypothetical protein
MPKAEQITAPTPYATSADFGQIFHDEMEGLYLLSFLLTADREKAEQCFVSGRFNQGEPSFQGMGALVGSAGNHSERHTSHQPAADGEN